MSKLFLDCEFDGYQGKLISIGISSECNQEFYAYVDSEIYDPWVKKNVVSKLKKFRDIGDSLLMVEAVSDTDPISEGLEEYLSQFDGVEIIADWPEDITYFTELLITGPGERIDTPSLTMKVYREINSDASEVPHNALEDARAIKKMYFDVFKG